MKGQVNPESTRSPDVTLDISRRKPTKRREETWLPKSARGIKRATMLEVLSLGLRGSRCVVPSEAAD